MVTFSSHGGAVLYSYCIHPQPSSKMVYAQISAMDFSLNFFKESSRLRRKRKKKERRKIHVNLPMANMWCDNGDSNVIPLVLVNFKHLLQFLLSFHFIRNYEFAYTEMYLIDVDYSVSLSFFVPSLCELLDTFHWILYFVGKHYEMNVCLLFHLFSRISIKIHVKFGSKIYSYLLFNFNLLFLFHSIQIIWVVLKFWFSWWNVLPRSLSKNR